MRAVCAGNMSGQARYVLYATQRIFPTCESACKRGNRWSCKCTGSRERRRVNASRCCHPIFAQLFMQLKNHKSKLRMSSRLSQWRLPKEGRVFAVFPESQGANAMRQGVGGVKLQRGNTLCATTWCCGLERGPLAMMW